MTRFKSTYSKFIGLIIFVCFSTGAFAEQCYRGTLDKQY